MTTEPQIIQLQPMGNQHTTGASLYSNGNLIVQNTNALSHETSMTTQLGSLTCAIAILLAIGWALRWRKRTLVSQYAQREKTLYEN